MRLNEAGLNLLKAFESCRLKSYQDLGGVWTIGYGSTRGVLPDMIISQAEADQRLLEDLDEKCNAVQRLVPKKLSDNEFSALVSFTYNVGEERFAQSMLRHCIKTGNMDHAAKEFLRWCKVDGKEIPGLLRRRIAERDLFVTPDRTGPV